MDSDGSDARPITDPPRVGEWGNAVLPFGDYDPRISPDGTANHNATPDYYPDTLVIHFAVFSPDDMKIYFVGEWW
ncbi:MAG: hypothetical protein MUP92_02940 [Actinobacteria bacterium]|nr:hypothetical protein [Actinomycetota bacterium]